MSTLEKIRQNREQIIAIANKYGATNLRLFGSVARGQDDETSDIDILIDWERPHSLLERFDIQDDLEKILGKETDVVVAGNLSGYRKERILREAKPL